jgi:hypothetical protein
LIRILVIGRDSGDPLKKTAPLIREQFDIYDKLQEAYPKPVSYRGILWIIRLIIT